MKKFILFALVGLLSFIISLVVQAPLPVVLDLLKPNNLSFQSSSGSLFKGQLAHVQVPNAPTIKILQWELEPKALLVGHFMAKWSAEIPDGTAQGVCGYGVDMQWHCAQLEANVSLDTLQTYLPPLQISGMNTVLGGDALIQLQGLSWSEGHLPTLAGQVEWISPEIIQPFPIQLGEAITAQITGSTTQLSAELNADQAILEVEGSNVVLQNDGSYIANILAKKSERTPDLVAQNLQLTLGQANNAGEFQKTFNSTLNLPKLLSTP